MTPDWRDEPLAMAREAFTGLPCLGVRRELAVAIARAINPMDAADDVERITSAVRLTVEQRVAVTQLTARLNDLGKRMRRARVRGAA